MTYHNIAFIGKAGAGKTTAAELLQEIAPGYDRVPFASPLKRIAVELFGPGSDTDRELLQWFGTDVVRKRDPDTWIRMWEKRIDDGTAFEFVTDDMRFENEWWAARARGFVIVEIQANKFLRIDRLKANGKYSEGMEDHESEQGFGDLKPDHWFHNNGTKLDIMNSIIHILNETRNLERV